MWPREFKFFKEFMDDLRTVFILNTVKSYDNGLTYYDLQSYGNIPHSKIYRIIKDMEDKGDLIRKNDISKETGRPKHLYFLSEKGKSRLVELKQNVGKIFEFIKLRFPDKNPEFDHKKFLDDATFKVWSSPVEYLKCKDISDEKKLDALLEMESDVTRILKKIRKEKEILQKKLEVGGVE